MTALLAPQATAREQLDRAVVAALAGLSPHTVRVYRARIEQFHAWSLKHGAALTRESVSRWAQELTDADQSAVAVNQALSAMKRLASEAAALGWLDQDTALRIGTIRSRTYHGTKTGTWLTLAQIRLLLALPDRRTLSGARDACALSLLVGCGLRRAEACSLRLEQIDRTNGMVLRNLVGKGNRVRTLTVPDWAARDIDGWIALSGIVSGRLLRSFHLNEPLVALDL